VIVLLSYQIMFVVASFKHQLSNKRLVSGTTDVKYVFFITFFKAIFVVQLHDLFD